MSRTKTEYYKTLDDVHAEHGFVRDYCSRILRESDIKKTKNGYPKLSVDKAIREWKQSKVRGDGSLKDEKLKREIDKLDIEIGKLRDQLKPMTEWLNEVQEITTITKIELEQWVQWIAAEFKEPGVYDRAISARDNLLNRLSEKVKDAQDAHGTSVHVVDNPAA